MVVHRSTGRIEHRRFYELGDYVRAGDLLVANESRVMPARLIGRKVPTGGRVEVLLLQPMPQAGEEGQEQRVWEALVNPGGRVREGTLIGFGDAERGPYMQAEVLARTESGGRLLRFDRPPRPLLNALGQMPLPPYIRETLKDPERYQTVYARTEGSAAAPTAGLHFTQRLIEELKAKGVGFTTLTLHVGLDTFRPVHETRVEEHRMHREWYHFPEQTALAVTRARQTGHRVVAVGTTSVRVLETVAQEQGIALEDRQRVVRPSEGWTGLYITPGYRFGLVDAMITNFHLPRTTLLMLVCAFGGYELIMRSYQEAIRERYRFYSFGDAMLIL
jgi:S-adenosylmethionine:tRNA ribosyltransferase-isomerase